MALQRLQLDRHWPQYHPHNQHINIRPHHSHTPPTSIRAEYPPYLTQQHLEHQPITENITSGHSQLKAFSLSNLSSSNYCDYNNAGLHLGWGLRNSVGVAEHPFSGGIYSVKNSVDQIQRKGKDIHKNNPGEEINFHNYLNSTEYAPQGSNYSYPFYFFAWQPTNLPKNANLTVGSPFQIGNINSTNNNVYYITTRKPHLRD